MWHVLYCVWVCLSNICGFICKARYSFSGLVMILFVINSMKRCFSLLRFFKTELQHYIFSRVEQCSFRNLNYGSHFSFHSVQVQRHIFKKRHFTHHYINGSSYKCSFYHLLCLILCFIWLCIFNEILWHTWTSIKSKDCYFFNFFFYFFYLMTNQWYF